MGRCVRALADFGRIKRAEAQVSGHAVRLQTCHTSCAAPCVPPVRKRRVCTRKSAAPHCWLACAAQIADNISELKLGNGTSVLITANIASALPTSVGAALQQAADKDSSALPIYALAFFITTLGVVYVQEVRAVLSPPSSAYFHARRSHRSCCSARRGTAANYVL